ncbi:MAG: tetrahydromethanopterin S-methyltransferase subunit H, partial [Halobacteriota archaeon]
MFKFDKKQTVFEIGGFHVGGQPGEYPTVLGSSMFYDKHKVVSDAANGIFDKEAAEAQWNVQVELSDMTSVGYWNQVIAETEVAMQKYIDWHLEVAPGIAFLVDSSVPSVRMFAAKYVTEIGAANLAVYNSVNASALDEEWVVIGESDVNSAIVLAFNPTDVSVKGRIDMLTVGGVGQEKGLLQSSEEAGITRPLLDVASLSLGAGAGQSIRSMVGFKGVLGLPTGGGPHNIPDAWTWLRRYRKTGHELNRPVPEVWEPCSIGANMISGIVGADYLLYGPIDLAPIIFPAMAMIDIIVQESTSELGVEPQTEETAM